MLDIAEITVRFGGVAALDTVSFSVESGTCCAIIGPNGAGKTTLFNVLTGLISPDSGVVLYDDHNLTKTPRYEFVGLGISRTFQNLALCKGLSVLENVMLGAGHRATKSALQMALRTLGARKEDRAFREECLRLLSSFDLASSANQPITNMPYGSLKRIELARAIAAKPNLLLLDEPAAGLTHGETFELAEILRAMHRESGICIVLVEHHIGFVMSLANQAVVLDFGRVLANGAPDEVVRDPAVIEAYLGVSA